MELRVIKRDIVGAFIFSSDGKLLLGKNAKGGTYAGCFVVPGGGVEVGETCLEALTREIKEETGIDIRGSKIEQFEEILTGQSEKVLKETGERVMVEMRFFDFKVELVTSSQEVRLRFEDDFAEAYWFHKSEVASLTLSPSVRTRLQKAGLLSESE